MNMAWDTFLVLFDSDQMKSTHAISSNFSQNCGLTITEMFFRHSIGRAAVLYLSDVTVVR